jgi:parallel beta-helix repeat protein
MGTTARFALCLCMAAAVAPARAATLTVDCAAGEKIQDKVVLAKPGDTVQVSGTCNENVRIPGEIVRVTLDGQGKAAIQGAPKLDVIYSRGREITIKGFTLSGGRDGIHLSGGGGAPTAVITDNTIRKTGRHGIHFDHGSIGRISNNIIEDVPATGIDVNEASIARIGYLTGTVGGSGNTIRNAGRHGMVIARGSSARILGNTVVGAKGSGIYIHRSSQADIIGNDISGSGADGITVRHGSGVNFTLEDTTLKLGANRSGAKNEGAGVSCAVGGYVEGPIGTLDGTKGAKEFDSGCLDRIGAK